MSEQLPQRPKVLFVDDERLLLPAVSRLLRDRCDVLTCDDPRKALQLVEKQPVDLIVTDYTMPGLDGLAMLASMREAGVRAPAVLLTAAIVQEPIDQALAAGLIAAVFHKPFDTQELRRALLALLPG